MIKMIFFLSAFPFPSRLKAFLLKCFGAKIGRNVVFKPRINIHFPWKLEVGDNSWLGEEVMILNFEKITIGANVCISQRAFLCGGNHDYNKPSMPYRNGPITLNDGCWIGACGFIAPNVTVGIDSVITAASIVTANVPPNLVFSSYPKEFSKARWPNSF